MSYQVSGGPGQEPPSPGSDESDSIASAVYSKTGRRLVIIIFAVVIVGIVGVVFFVSTAAQRQANSTSTTVIQSNSMPLPAMPRGLPKLTLKQACTMMPPIFTAGDQITAAALADVAAGQTLLPTVEPSQLVGLIVRLQVAQATAPEPLSSQIAKYTEFYLSLRQLKMGTENGTADSTKATSAEKAIKAIC